MINWIRRESSVEYFHGERVELDGKERKDWLFLQTVTF